MLAFGPSELADDDRWSADLRATYGRAVVVGCSTAGEIVDDRVTDHLVVTVVRFASTRLCRAAVPVSASSSHDDGRALAAAIGAAEPAPALVLVLSDGVAVNGSRLVDGIAAGLGPGPVVTGGLAADADRFARTWALVDGRLTEGCVVAVGLAGDRLRVGHGSQGGCTIFGPERRITAADGNVLLELDAQPALDLYRHYLGERAADLPGSALLFPLSVRHGPDDPHRVVRSVLGIDDDRRSLTFAGDLPCGGTAQLMRASVERLTDGAHAAALESLDSLAAHVPPAPPSPVPPTAPAGPLLAIGVSCVARRLVLGERVEEETEAVLDALPGGSRLVGFYSYGEISPVADGPCALHNQTMTLTVLSEDPPGPDRD